MSSTYKVVSGDTFELISRRVYGTEGESSRIARANPGAVEPLQAGTTLIIPPSPAGPVDRRADIPAASLSEVAIRIDGKRFRFWESVRIRRSLDSLDTVELTAPFSVDLPGFRETFVPFTYKQIDVTIGGVLLFTGTLVSVIPEITKDRKSIVASGYSLPGVLNDCTMPANAAPLEYSGQNLQQIAESVAGVFGLSVEFADDPRAVFTPEVRMMPGKKVLAFLTDLAKQRNMVIGNTESGALLFRRSTGDGAPVAKFRQGQRPLTSINPVFKPQEYFSDITGIEPVFFGFGGGAIPEINPRLPGVMRPFVFDITDTESAPAVDTVKAKMGRMFGNAASYSIEVATIHDPVGAVWSPDSIVTLLAPDAMVYNESRFTIRTVDIARTRDKESAVLNLALPGAFGGQIPEALPWDD